MCGIAGYFGDISRIGDARTILNRMNAAIGHRWPDARDMHVAKGAGLAHTRLSIVGLSDGQQPMASPTAQCGSVSTAKSSITSNCAMN